MPLPPTILKRRRQGRLKQLAQAKPFILASLVEISRQCGNPTCRCTTGAGHPGWYLTSPAQGKTRTLYVPQAALDEVRAWVQEGQQLKGLLKEISELSFTLLQAQARVRRAQRQRRR